MRRLFICMIVAFVAFSAVKALRHRPARHAPPPRHQDLRHPRDGASGRELAADARRKAEQAVAEARRSIDKAGHEVRRALHEAGDEIRQAYHQAGDEIRQAYHQAVAEDEGRLPLPPPPPLSPRPVVREEVDGLPVPIVPGTRVTDAQARPPVAARPPARARAPIPARIAVRPAQPAPLVAAVAGPVPTAAVRLHPIDGQICATEQRARADALNALRTYVVAEWLDPDVPASWTPPAGLLQAMIVETRIDPVEKPYGTLYIARLKADVSPQRRAALVEAYNREQVQHRLVTLGGALAFVLICLAAISGYIRADEATKGYYTNRLRMLAAAGVGAAGVIVYRMMV